MGVRVRNRDSKQGPLGSAGCGCALLFVVGIGWAISLLIFPKLPGYDEAMKAGEAVGGQVVRVEAVENITINDRHPQRVFFRYGGNREGSMMIAMGESASTGQNLTIRVLDGQAYPEDLRPFKRPAWLHGLLIFITVVAALFIVGGVLRLLVIGGVLFAAGRSIAKANDPPPPPPPPSDEPPPPPPPAS